MYSSELLLYFLCAVEVEKYLDHVRTHRTSGKYSCDVERRMACDYLPTILSLVYSFVSYLAFFTSLRSSQNETINSSGWKTKMSQNEDSIKESQTSSESLSEESMFEDETMCWTHRSYLSDEDIIPYTDDPLADPTWTAAYEKEMN